MRVRNGIAVVVSVVLLLAMGVIGIVVNRSALQAADTVHRADSLALGVNNGTLSGQMLLLSAAELHEFTTDAGLRLRPGDAADRRALAQFQTKTAYFEYGLALTDMAGTPLNGTRSAGLPPVTDPGYGPMRASLRAGGPGFSSVMLAGDVALAAVAVPVLLDGAPKGVLIGYHEVAKTQLQRYVRELSAKTHLTTILDSTGRVAATSDPALIGTVVDPAVVTAGRTLTEAEFVEYKTGDTDMIAVVVPRMPGGWTYVRSQTKASFEGAVHSRNQTITVTLLAMLAIGVIGISLLGYRTQLQRRRADERFQALFQHAPDMVAVLDSEGRIQFASPSAAAVLHIPVGSMQGHSVFELVHPEDRDRMRTELAGLVHERGGVLRLQCRMLDSSGTLRWFEFTASNQMHNPALAGIVINARDVSENRAFQERLTHEAQHDALTGLPNRRRMQDALGSSLAGDPVAVLFVDLDGFKPVNDVHGHEAGDELLRQVAGRLSACVRERDVLSRVGGDEFVVLMPGVVAPDDAESMKSRVRDVMRVPFMIGDREIRIGASVGIHLAAEASDPDQALRAADHAMYEAKWAGRERRSGERRVGRHRAEP
jgi:diguanylate cyclase (GGDEF)-like protein/PAS domain S-box-containing protein